MRHYLATQHRLNRYNIKIQTMKTILKLVFLSIVLIVAVNYLDRNNIDVVSEGKSLINRIRSEIEQFSAEQDEKTSPEEIESENKSALYNYQTSQSTSPAWVNTHESPDDEVVVYDENAEFTEFPIPPKNDNLNSRFQELDRFASSVPAQNKSSLFDLVNYLIIPAKNELEKTRLIFTWIALNISYDDYGYNTGNYSDCSAEGVFKSGRAVCEGYSNLFEQMGKLAKLDIYKIKGYAKGISYREGSTFKNTNHAWNVAKIEGQWKLFDVTWASGYGRGVNGKLVSTKEFNDYWFDVDPAAFIFSHLPEDSQWQMIPGNISKQQFERLPYADSPFFRFGFEGKYCLENAMSGNLRQFPKSYGIQPGVQVVSLPYQKQINGGKPYKMALKSNRASDIAIINNGQWIHLTKNGEDFSIVMIPRAGQLTVNVKFNGNSGGYATMLEYSVN